MSTDSSPIRLTKSKKRSSVHHSAPLIANQYSSYRKPKIIRYATIKLLADLAPELIQHVYSHQHQEWFREPEIRVGLALKLLHHSTKQYDESVLAPILDDIDQMLHSDSYLQGTGHPEARTKCLEEEYQLIQRSLKLDDNISLNTDLDDLTIPLPQISLATHPSISLSNPSVPSNTPLDNESCVIM